MKLLLLTLAIFIFSTSIALAADKIILISGTTGDAVGVTGNPIYTS